MYFWYLLYCCGGCCFFKGGSGTSTFFALTFLRAKNLFFFKQYKCLSLSKTPIILWKQSFQFVRDTVSSMKEAIEGATINVKPGCILLSTLISLYPKEGRWPLKEVITITTSWFQVLMKKLITYVQYDGFLNFLSVYPVFVRSSNFNWNPK